MTATRSPLGKEARLPWEAIRTGWTVAGDHGLALARAVNDLEFGGGLLFSNAWHSAALSTPYTSAAVRLKVPTRANGARRVWVVNCGPPSHGASGVVRLVPTPAPNNSAESQWAVGRVVTPPGSSGAVPGAIAPLVYYEEVVSAGASAAADLRYTLSWTGTGTVTVSSVACWELPRNYATSGVSGADQNLFVPGRPVFAGASDDVVTGGTRQLLSRLRDVHANGNHRALFCRSNPDDSPIKTDNDETYGQVFADTLRIHPRRLYRTDPGFSYGPVTVWIYAKTTATSNGSVRIKSAYDTTGVEITGWTTTPAWQSTTINCYLEPTYLQPSARSATVRGLLTGQSAGTDYAAEAADRSDPATADVEGLTVECRGKLDSKDAANTLNVYAVIVLQNTV